MINHYRIPLFQSQLLFVFQSQLLFVSRKSTEKMYACICIDDQIFNLHANQNDIKVLK